MRARRGRTNVENDVLSEALLHRAKGRDPRYAAGRELHPPLYRLNERQTVTLLKLFLRWLQALHS
jgi:hypothetical protein